MMRALEIAAPNQAAMVERPIPEPGPDEVLVRVGAVGICGSDIELLHGERPAPYARYPIIPGHEWAGTVAAIGANVTEVAPGDLVVAEGFRSCGQCERCREGKTNLCTGPYAETGFTHDGAFAAYVTVPARLIHRLPATASLAEAALLEPAACVASGLLDVSLRPGLRIAVVGAGTLGLLAAQMLRLTSPRRLVSFDVRPERLERARRWGEAATVTEALGEAGSFDLVFEATGRPGGAENALRLARRGGTVLLAGIAGQRSSSLPADLIPLGQLRVQGIFGASSAAWSWVVDLFSAGLLDLAPLLTHQFDLSEYEDAFATLQNPLAGAVKVQLIP